LTFEKGFYYSTYGKVEDANGNVHCTNLIPVKAGDKFKITTTYGWTAVLVAEFDSTQTMVSYHGLNSDGGVKVTDYEYTVSSGISYIAINNRYQENTPMVLKKVVVDSVKHRIAELEKGGTGGTGTPGKDGITPEFSIGEVETLPAGSEATASITGTKENPVLNLGIPKGEDGKDGTGGTVDIPSTLPNPHKLTITGAVNAEYDGSTPVEVNIPAGGGGGAEPIWEEVVTHTIEAEATTWSYGFDATDEILVIATGLKCNKALVCIDMCVNDGVLSISNSCMSTGNILHDTSPTTLRAHIKAIDDGLFKGEHYESGGAASCVWRGGIGIHSTNNKTRKITKFSIAAQAYGTNKLTAGTITIKRRVN
jgi:hypothetical protein